MDNVLFGQPFEDRYWRVIEDSCLLPNLQLRADKDLTEVRCMLGSNVLIIHSADFFAVL
jgi:hypothetical protein